jgi:ADP-ribose pyrophosphatase
MPIETIDPATVEKLGSTFLPAGGIESSGLRRMKQHGPWRIVESHHVYQDAWIRVRKDEVIRPDGKPGMHSVVTLKPGITVLAVDDDGNVYLTEEFHYGVGRTTVEAVSGGIEPDELPLGAAKRELREELGIEAEEWLDLGVVDPFTASVVSPTQLYLARKLRFGDQSPEGTEQIQCVKMTLAEAVQKVITSEITHGPSCVVILKAAMNAS